MTRLVAILLATSALTLATQAGADVYTDAQEQPFFWTDAPDQPKGPAEKAPAQNARPNPAPQPSPMLENYPVDKAPITGYAVGGPAPKYLDDDCMPSQAMPETQLMKQTAQETGRHEKGMSASDRRRGEMAGDDGVLEAIQDTPCAYIHRRGGENGASAREHTHPDDIRRVNTLEDRRIPIHEVGRYSPEGSGSWDRDPNNPYVDASRSWTIHRGTMVSEVLMAWGEEAGFNVIWRASHDYPVQADVTIRGTFPEAAGAVIESFADATPPLSGEFYLKNRVLVVDSASTFESR